MPPYPFPLPADYDQALQVSYIAANASYVRFSGTLCRCYFMKRGHILFSSSLVTPAIPKVLIVTQPVCLQQNKMMPYIRFVLPATFFSHF